RAQRPSRMSGAAFPDSEDGEEKQGWARVDGAFEASDENARVEAVDEITEKHVVPTGYQETERVSGILDYVGGCSRSGHIGAIRKQHDEQWRKRRDESGGRDGECEPSTLEKCAGIGCSGDCEIDCENYDGEHDAEDGVVVVRKGREKQGQAYEDAVFPPGSLLSEEIVQCEHVEGNRKSGDEAQVPKRVGEKKRAESKGDAAEERGGFVAANPQAEQSPTKRAESQLQNQRQIVGNDGAGEQAERQIQNSSERVERAPSQICTRGIEEQVRVEGIVARSDGSGEIPEEPCVLEIVSGIAEERGRGRERRRQRENCRGNHAEQKNQQVIAHGRGRILDTRRMRRMPDGMITSRRFD